jgi:predicted nucleic acid-binding protein
MARIVLSDASPLIGLALVNGLDWLPHLFGEVWIPASVQQEVLPGVQARGELEISQALSLKHIRVWSATIPKPRKSLGDLDAGEMDCLSIALSLPDGQCLVLMDERAGRATAKELGIQVAGTAAVIGLAQKQGLVSSAKACFARLHASDFRISKEVIQAVLAQVGEA